MELPVAFLQVFNGIVDVELEGSSHNYVIIFQLSFEHLRILHDKTTMKTSPLDSTNLDE